MSGILNVLLAASGVAVELPTSITALHEVLQPNNATASISFSSAGTYTNTGGSGGTWMNSGSGADYEIRYSPNGDAPTGSLTATWLALSSARTWTLSETNDGGGLKTCTGTLEIRLASDSTVLDSCTATITAFVDV